MPLRERRRVVRTGAVALGAVALLMTVACWPTRRLVSVNFVVTEQSLPLWAKAVDFLQRDINVAATATAVLGEAADADARAAAALTWTRASVRPTPAGFPVVDDHIWHIVVRGYGEPDQQADVFTTMLTYAGERAFWTLAGEPPHELPLSYVWIRDQWRVYDVAHGVAFRNRHGDLATPAELAADRQLVTAAARAAGVDEAAYDRYFRDFAPPPVPDVTRADLQIPRRRLWHEARRAIGLEGREWQMRPHRSGVRAEGHEP